ncbi:erythromycin esterase family protein [Piscinibacter koreensis]|uniref:Erythromycin esterase family protein n=1 Tax=Piscinibacter koreensis TaxID=2742824 RepID=A0A7Y6NMN3_9BURK|nr:erythromycin esterase family protein [Schlegelella koreensis]NUZ05921.1 erythromycin esterase family protein [Schlegelella koreensis]
MKPADLSAAIGRHAVPLDDLGDVDAIVEAIGDSRIVLLGESTHGTREFYRVRAEVTRRLIERKGFDAVAAEADWPAALRASRYAQGAGSDGTAEQALGDFERFPRWMWRNTEVVRWLEGLRAHNASRQADERVGFFGLDLYSLRESMDAVVRYLDREDPEAARRARARYACFDDLADDPQAYGHAVSFGMRPGCERGVLLQLAELCRAGAGKLRRDGGAASDELFYAQQNARVVHNAEVYYRTMFGGRTDSWNVRDRHMGETLQLLADHIERRRGRPARIVVWAHNSHVGDARATDSARHGQLNLGQLAREGFTAPGETFLLGFTTHTGTVTAAHDWDEPSQTKRVLPSRPDSIERVLHDSGGERFLLGLRNAAPELRRALAEERLERAIGVIYRPDTERWSHYFDASLARQFDAVVHIDTTEALRPLGVVAAPAPPEAPETFPSGL